MPPKNNKAKSKASSAAPAPSQQKSLSVRTRELQSAAAAATDEPPPSQEEQQQQELQVWRPLSYTSVLTFWDLCKQNFCLVEDAGCGAPLWRDSFTVSVAAQHLSPPLHQYLHPDEQLRPSETLLVEMWREHRLRERLQLGYKLLELGDVTSAAMLAADIAPAADPKDWGTRLKLACAAYKHAWHSRWRARGPSALQPIRLAEAEGSLLLEDVHWLRAQWLLGRTLATVVYAARGRSSALLTIVASALVEFAPEDPLGARFMVQRALAAWSAWGGIDFATEQHDPEGTRQALLNAQLSLGHGWGADTHTMASTYNRALACYHSYGPDHRVTLAALRAALERDPQRWVPLLLAGGALAAPDMAPLVALGSKAEATSYCREFGLLWNFYAFSPAAFNAVIDDDEPMRQAAAVTWLAAEAGLKDLVGRASDLTHTGVLMCNQNMPQNCSSCVVPIVIEELQVRTEGSMSRGTPGSAKPETCPSLVRALLSLLVCLCAATTNLPPPDACDASQVWQHWAATSKMLNVTMDTPGAVACLKGRLVDCATALYDISKRVVAQCRVWQQQQERGELRGRLGLLWPGECCHWERTLQELLPGRIRLLWQAGQLRLCKDLASDLLQQQEQLHSKLQQQLSSCSDPHAREAALAAILSGTCAAPGPVLHSLTALQDMVSFLNQQSVEAARRSLASRARSGGSSNRGAGSSSSSGEVQYQRYDVLAPDAQRRFVSGVLDAAGGAACIEAAVNKAKLFTLYSKVGSSAGAETVDSSDDEGEDEGQQGDEDFVGGPQQSRLRYVALRVLELLLTSHMPSAAKAGRAQQQQQQGGAGASSSSSRATSSSGGDALVAALRAMTGKQHQHVAATPRGYSGFSQAFLCHVGRVGSSNSDMHGSTCPCCAGLGPDAGLLDAAVVEVLRNREMLSAALGLAATRTGTDAAKLQRVQQLLEQVMLGQDDDEEQEDEEDGSSSSMQQGRRVRQRQAQQQQQVTDSVAGLPASASTSGNTAAAMFGSSSSGGGGGGGGGSTTPAGSSAAGQGSSQPTPVFGGQPSTSSSAEPSSAPATAPSGGKQKGKVCEFCGQLFPKLYRCSGCAAVGLFTGYCSAACQKAHWAAGHKRVCGKA